MFTYSLSSFIILGFFFDIVIINIYRILVFALLYNAFGQLGTLAF